MGGILGIIILVLIPPLGVFLRVGLGAQFWINLLLWILIPVLGGLVHGIWVYTKNPV